MNPTNQFFKKQGLKVCLPLLLLATACGEGATSSLQSDKTVDVTPVATATDSGGVTFKGSQPQPVPTAAPVVLPPEGKSTLGDKVLPPTSEEEEAPATPVTPVSTGTTQVPEPTALAGLAIAAAGIVVVKRKQQAA